MAKAAIDDGAQADRTTAMRIEEAYYQQVLEEQRSIDCSKY
jgi:hypothetical protein